MNLVGVSPGGVQQLLDPANVANDNYVFTLYENLKGQDRINKLCQECKDKKVTWEGVYDGQSCLDPNYLPRSDGTKDAASSANKC